MSKNGFTLHRNGAGFTLIELLIAISIIAILSVIGMSAYSAIYKSSRDAQRKSDIKFMQSALEDYHADKIYYPFTIAELSTESRKYMTQIPEDPSKTPNYLYLPQGANCVAATPRNCTSYCIYAKMEMPIQVTASDVGCGRNGVFPSGGYNYGLTRP